MYDVVQTVSTMVYLQEVEVLGKRLGEINVHLHWCVYVHVACVCERWGGAYERIDLYHPIPTC